ncbi:hypothetical protein [Leptospira borgpetersenii]|uniref:hypothetical protein n=1 Tax=Leptospira borgpetersenii TaxID=174 RepID=UPI00029780AB|nr:hypothetical protein [Leptospira borgpetersenii]EMO12074.1 hypothetical protein LEP1GSC137_0983 [Leptospira borgpetersenii str. Noumea 25]EKR01479.1 hypothetical protein LEP1GSC121_0003 [Leptospira borgpetersenii serovar Castellonis str. 200801910]MBE8159644.1 hypothetical protein [Leptospira borgpetersenii serovar Ballum]MBE8163989.1 hypothetical protein [Leptospira borgpetersenii serovar Ballum]MBE8169390.1 hypothetical protein [Leptospira borgpetersenii serovar Ballum]
MIERYAASKKQTIQVNFESFLYDMRSEFKKGKKKAFKSGNKLPITAIAQNKSVLKNKASGTHPSQKG